MNFTNKFLNKQMLSIITKKISENKIVLKYFIWIIF